MRGTPAFPFMSQYVQEALEDPMAGLTSNITNKLGMRLSAEEAADIAEMESIRPHRAYTEALSYLNEHAREDELLKTLAKNLGLR